MVSWIGRYWTTRGARRIPRPSTLVGYHRISSRRARSEFGSDGSNLQTVESDALIAYSTREHLANVMKRVTLGEGRVRSTSA